MIYGKTFLIGLTDLITEYLNDTQKQIHLENYMAFQLIETYRIALSKDYRCRKVEYWLMQTSEFWQNFRKLSKILSQQICC